MKKLDEIIKTNNSTYFLKQRTPNTAIYSQIQKDSSGKDFHAGYEVFRITKLPQTTIFSKSYPPHEKYPAPSDFGHSAFAYASNAFHKAIDKYNELEGETSK